MTYKRLLSKALMFSLVITNIQTYSFANERSLEQNKYSKEISNIETKKDLQKTAQKAVKAGEIDTWVENMANMPTSRYRLTSSVVDKKIYCIGGFNDIDSLDTVEMYDPSTDTWKTKASMPTSRYNFTSSVVDGKIYCIGGWDGKYLNTVEMYDPTTDTWETKTPMPSAREFLTSSVVDGKIYCIGGNNASVLGTVEVYDPKTDSWETKANMPTTRYGLASSVVDGKIYCIGGYKTSFLNKVEAYDPATDTWETKSYMPTTRRFLTSSTVGGKIYCIGGENNISLNKLEVYNPATNIWETKTNMPTTREGLTSSVVDGKIYCIGGYGIGHLNTVEAYIADTPPTEEEIAEEAVSKAEQSKDPVDIEEARDLVNQLPESSKKDELNDRLDAILPNISTNTQQSLSNNADIYIKMKNTLSLSLDTNSITFENFSGVEDMEKLSAVNLTVESSLPYEVNASLETEIQNADKTEIVDKSILGIRANGSTNYKTFTAINTPLNLLDNQVAGKINTHGIDLILRKDIIHKADVYKTTIRFEVNQK